MANAARGLTSEPETPGTAGGVAHFCERLRAAEAHPNPFRHWIIGEALPAGLTEALAALPLEAPDVGDLSGARELHNDTRSYVDAAGMAHFPACRSLAELFLDPATLATIEAVTGADLDGTYLRIEIALDSRGFWLKPHTDLGVKRFTMLHYLAPAGRPDLGTDLYADPATHALSVPFEPGTAVIFKPSTDTWHGFEPRPIDGVRRSVIINYVTDEWRAREQLVNPEHPLRTRG